MQRLPTEGTFNLQLTRQKNLFSLRILEDGYRIQNKDLLASLCKTTFFFLDEPRLEELCHTLGVCIQTLEKKQKDTCYCTLIQIPQTFSPLRTHSSNQSEGSSNVFSFPMKKE